LHWYYDTLEIAGYLNKGTNTITALVWNYGEYLPWSFTSNQTGFLLEGPAGFEVFNTDDSWKCIQI
jgi:hypothetical protein